MVYEIDGTKIIDTYFKASQRADDYQIRLYRGNAEFAGPYATYKYDVGADVVVANVFTSGMDGTTWKVELSEDGGKTWSAMTAMAQNYGDRWIRGYHIGVEKHPVESGTSPCYHQYQCKLKIPKRPASWFVRPTASAMSTRRLASTRATISPRPRVIDPPGRIYRAGCPVAARFSFTQGGGTG